MPKSNCNTSNGTDGVLFFVSLIIFFHKNKKLYYTPCAPKIHVKFESTRVLMINIIKVASSNDCSDDSHTFECVREFPISGINTYSLYPT